MDKTEKIYLKVIYWGIFLCAFTPLILYNQFLSMFHFPKMIVFRSIVEIMLIFYVLLILANKKYRPKWNALLITITIFTGLYILIGLIGVNPYRSFWGTLERMGGAFSFIHYWIFFVILISVFGRNNTNATNRYTNATNNSCAKDWGRLLKLCVVVGFLSILFAYGQYFDLGDFFVGWQHGRLFGTMGNAALFAGYLIFVLFLALYLLLKNNTNDTNRYTNATNNSCGRIRVPRAARRGLRYSRAFYGLVIVLGVPALFLTAIRGSILSFLGAIFLLGLYLALTSKNPKLKKASIALIVLLVIIVSVFWFNRNMPWVQENRYLQQITDISLETRTVQTRISAWKSAWQGWQERFWLGWGPENFNVLFAKYFDPMHYEGFGSEMVWDRAHNELLNTGATMGIVGLLSYLSIFVVLFWYIVGLLKKNNADMRMILGAMFVAYIGHNLSFFDTFNSYLMLFITMGYISFISGKTQIVTPNTMTSSGTGQAQNNAEELRADPRNYPRLSASIDGRRKAVAVVLGIIVIFTIWKTAVIPAKANYAATRGIVYGRSEETYPAAFDYFRKSLGYNPTQGEYEIRHHLGRMVFRIFSKGDNIQRFGVGEKDIIFAIDEVSKNIKTDPLDPIPYLYAARLNEYLSRVEQEENLEKAEQRLDEAERLLEVAKPLNEKNPYIYFESGQVKIFQNRFEEAIELFDQGISIRPEVELGYWYKGVTYLDMGEIEKGEEFIKQAVERGYKKNTSDIHRLLRIYVPIKDYPAIIELYLEAIALEPINAQFYTSLATAYKENGEIDKAIEMARKAIEVDPKLKAEAEAWIEMMLHNR